MRAQMAHSSASRIDLAGLAACQGLAQRSRTHVAAIGAIQHMNAGTTLFSEGDEAEDRKSVV